MNFILAENKTIEEIDLSDNGLDDDGIGELCNSINSNSTITKLNLSRNFFGTLGAEQLRKSLEDSKSIKMLDISGNALGYSSISSLANCCSKKGIIVSTDGNFVFEEILNSLSHGIAFIISVVGSCVLLSRAADETSYTDYHFWACVLYSFSLMFLFLSSCLFHCFFMLPTSKFF